MEQGNCVQPFDTIESAQEFMALLHQSLQEALDDVEDKLSDGVAANMPRRARALELAAFKLNQLRSHIISTERLLKDLHTLRDLLGKESAGDGLRPATQSTDCESA
jgi:hypothetical protein